MAPVNSPRLDRLIIQEYQVSLRPNPGWICACEMGARAVGMGMCLGEDSTALKSLKVGYAYVLTYHKLEDYTEKFKLLFSKHFGYCSCMTVHPMLIQRMQWTMQWL